jgi:competence protein ComEC
VGGATLKILFPDKDPSNLKSNESSIVIQLSYGDIDFLLTGDAPKSIEEHLVRVYGSDLESEVLKVGHHGSKTSSSVIFLNTVRPQYAVISAGSENRYGHPSAEVIERLEKYDLEIDSTIEDGSIVFMTDGVSIWKEDE